MDAIATIIKDIIDLRKESNNIYKGETVDGLFQHYEIILNIGKIELLYKYGELQGFAEWLRLPYIPKSEDFVPTADDIINGGPVLYIMNCCVRDDKKHKALWRLVHEIRSKNKGIKEVCWHNDDGKLYTIPYTKQEKGKEVERSKEN